MRDRPKSITIVGAGNTGSFAGSLVAHIVELLHVTIIDRDDYDEGNLISQNIEAADVGEAKAVVAGRRLQRINPHLKVTTIVDDARNVPLGKFRGDAILSCPDSKATRAWLNQVAWRLGVPLIDVGVNATAGRLAGVTVYIPGPDRPCLECAWSEVDYQRMEQAHPCANRSSDDVAVALDVPGRSDQAVITASADGRVSLQTELVACEAMSDLTRRATGLMLLTAAGAVRLVRPVVAESVDQASVGFAVDLDGVVNGARLADALSALSVACRVCGNEIEAVATDEATAHQYLSVRGWASRAVTSRRRTAGKKGRKSCRTRTPSPCACKT